MTEKLTSTQTNSQILRIPFIAVISFLLIVAGIPVGHLYLITANQATDIKQKVDRPEFEKTVTDLKNEIKETRELQQKTYDFLLDQFGGRERPPKKNVPTLGGPR